VNTACFRVFRVAHAEPTHISLALQALPLWRELEQALATRLLTLTGGIAHGRTAELDLLAWTLDAAGKPGRWLPHDEAVERWPGIRYDDRIFFHPLAGRLDAGHAVQAMRTTALRHRVAILHDTPATAIETRGTDLAEVHTTAGRYRARRVVVAAGAWSAGLLGDLVRLPPLRTACARSARFPPCAPA
jgi:sarcosine oxidase